MNKKTVLLTLFPFLMLSLHSASLFSEENSSSQNSQNAPSSNTNRVIPSPQKNRIEALEEELKNNGLGHQINPLKSDDSSFLTLYRAPISSDVQGCVILIPSDNEHPDWPDVISPIRNALPKHSWCTLSLEIPDIVKRATAVNIKTKADETTPAKEGTTLSLPNQNIVFDRISAAINDAKSKNINHFVLLGYGTGGAYALHYLSQNQASADALILIDIVTPKGTPPYQLAKNISLINHPILDYYAEQSERQKTFALWRKQAANARSNQDPSLAYIQLDELNDGQISSDDTLPLIQRVRGFLKQNTQQINQLKTFPEFKKGLFYQSP